jgi:hypothetical protein
MATKWYMIKTFATKIRSNVITPFINNLNSRKNMGLKDEKNVGLVPKDFLLQARFIVQAYRVRTAYVMLVFMNRRFFTLQVLKNFSLFNSVITRSFEQKSESLLLSSTAFRYCCYYYYYRELPTYVNIPHTTILVGYDLRVSHSRHVVIVNLQNSIMA